MWGELYPVLFLTLQNPLYCLVIMCFISFRKQAFTSIINPEWNFSKLGIGGLDKEFSAIFRRAFASRVFPPEIVDQLGNNCSLFFPMVLLGCEL